MVKHLACYLTDHKQKSINSIWLEIALWPQIWSLAPSILNVFTQIHHVLINEAVDTKTMLFSIGHRQIWMEGVNQCQYSPRHLDLLFEQLWRHSTWATPPPVVGCSAVVKQHKIYKFLCTNNFFARNHQKMHLGALFNISLREKGRWGWGGVQIKLLKGRLNTFRIKGANDQIWGHIAISSQLELILFCLWLVR